MQVQRNGKTQEETVSLKQVHYRVLLPLQLHIIHQRLASVETSASPEGRLAPSKYSRGVQLQGRRRQQLASMAAHLFPFPPAAPAGEDASKRRRQVPAAPDAFAHCKLSAGAVMVAKRRDAWMAAGVEDGAIELLHPGKKPLEIKLCVSTHPHVNVT